MARRSTRSSLGKRAGTRIRSAGSALVALGAVPANAMPDFGSMPPEAAMARAGIDPGWLKPTFAGVMGSPEKLGVHSDGPGVSALMRSMASQNAAGLPANEDAAFAAARSLLSQSLAAAAVRNAGAQPSAAGLTTNAIPNLAASFSSMAIAGNLSFGSMMSAMGDLGGLMGPAGEEAAKALGYASQAMRALGIGPEQLAGALGLGGTGAGSLFAGSPLAAALGGDLGSMASSMAGGLQSMMGQFLPPEVQQAMAVAEQLLSALGLPSDLQSLVSPPEVAAAAPAQPGTYVEGEHIATVMGAGTMHMGKLLSPGPGAVTVRHNAKPVWLVNRDFHACPQVKGNTPDVGGMVEQGAQRTSAEGAKVARYNDKVNEKPGGPNPIIPKSLAVKIQEEAARKKAAAEAAKAKADAAAKAKAQQQAAGASSGDGQRAGPAAEGGGGAGGSTSNAGADGAMCTDDRNMSVDPSVGASASGNAPSGLPPLDTSANPDPGNKDNFTKQPYNEARRDAYIRMAAEGKVDLTELRQKHPELCYDKDLVAAEHFMVARQIRAGVDGIFGFGGESAARAANTAYNYGGKDVIAWDGRAPHMRNPSPYDPDVDDSGAAGARWDGRLSTLDSALAESQRMREERKARESEQHAHREADNARRRAEQDAAVAERRRRDGH